jgi:hypothetical protein
VHLHPDSPITRSEDDALSRLSYANGIADSIAAYAPTDSVVLGIVGPWGSGKSSLINMIGNSLTAPGRAEAPLVVRFNPWRYAGSEQLFANFFATLARAIGVTDKIETLRKAAEKMRQTSAALGVLKVLPVAGHVLGGVASLAKAGAENVDALIEDFGTLDALHDDLSAELEAAKVRILVVIDDIDRLSPPEILQTFQLVKSLADFPYVMYLLAYDEGVVLRAVDPDPTVARRYLEKIVSLPIDVPPPHRSVIDNMIIGEMLELFRPALPPFFNEERLIGSYISGYRRYCSTLRDVRRFINLFAFNYARAGQFVDVGDLASVTALQVFEHELYQLVSQSASTFVDKDEAIWRQDRKAPQDNKQRIELLVERARCADPEGAVEALRSMFPKADLAYKGNAFELSWAKEKAEARIASPDHFHLFFNTGVEPCDVTDSEYRDGMLLARDDRDSFLSFMETLGIDKIIDFVERLREDRSVPDLGREARIAIIVSLCGLAERFDRRMPIGLLSLPFDWRIGYAISHILSAVPPNEWYEEELEALGTVRYGIGPAVSEVDRIVRMHGQANVGIPDFAPQQISAFQDAAIDAVRRAFSAGDLKNESHLGRVLHCLTLWGRDDLVEEIVTAIRQTPDMLIAFLASMQQRGGFEGILKPKAMHFSFEGIEKYIPREDIVCMLEPLCDTGYGDESVQRVVRDFLAQALRLNDPDNPHID